MVATKSKKAAKYSYAERVLSAFSQVQKEHRRNSVHMATLRAQVRKMAQEKKDKLGPQWAHWVAKAVHKLEEQGFLQHEETNGHISMTTDGRKALSVARKKLLPAPGNASSPSQEDAVYRSIAEQFSPYPNKRKAASRLRPLSEPGDDSDAEGTQSASVRGSPRKRPRTSAATAPSRLRSRSPQKSGQKPVSKMNKAELKAELKALQKARDQAAQMPGLSEADAQRLKSELEERDRQLRIARRELNTFRQSMPVPGARDHDMVTEPDDETPRPSSPAFSDRLTPLPDSPRIADAQLPPPSQPSFAPGITRTQSGSLIPHVSQRPTPAPSSPGIDNGPFGGADDDVFIDDQGGVDADPSRRGAEDDIPGDARAGTPRQVATPVSSRGRTPVPQGDTRNLEAEVESYKIRLEDAHKSFEGLEKNLRDKILILEATITDQSNRIVALEVKIGTLEYETSNQKVTIDNLTHEKAALTVSVGVQDQVITDRDRALADKDQALADKHIKLADKDRALADKDLEVADKERALADKNRALTDKDLELADKHQAIADLQTHINTYRCEIDELAGEKTLLVNTNTALMQDKEVLTHDKEALTQMNTRLALEKDAAIMENAVLAQENNTLSQAKTTLELEKTKLEQERATLEQANATLAQDMAVVTSNLADAEQGIQSTRTELQTVNAEMQALTTELQTTNAHLQAACTERDTLSRLADERTRALEERTFALDAQTERTRGLEENVARLGADLTNVQGAAGDLAAELAVVNEQRVGAETELERITAALQRAEGDLGRANADMEQGQARLEDMGVEIQRMVAEIAIRDNLLEKTMEDLQATTEELHTANGQIEQGQRAHAELVELREADAARIDRLLGANERLKEGYERMRTVQLEVLAEAEAEADAW
ncbi:hypothetical protein BJ138DRAFT_1083724 [Hygrophoropsis aurantiaca]|uniref:Uncharacterized protein n=1 Tax=Hygrophoropsis aurantiaca TaxID=72124 RepID=A0ACB8AHA0_9AGAM|nr:hypothetical protein BJ138DRAFT_1083724 [Hygrophoropsis aurantiaca]